VLCLPRATFLWGKRPHCLITSLCASMNLRSRRWGWCRGCDAVLTWAGGRLQQASASCIGTTAAVPAVESSRSARSLGCVLQRGHVALCTRGRPCALHLSPAQ
jgi:hypothetical protein